MCDSASILGTDMRWSHSQWEDRPLTFADSVLGAAEPLKLQDVARNLENESCNDVHRRAERNAEGGFFKIFQQNKWRLRKQKEAAAAGRHKQLSLF